jgi:hypothetical protein
MLYVDTKMNLNGKRHAPGALPPTASASSTQWTGDGLRRAAGLHSRQRVAVRVLSGLAASQQVCEPMTSPVRIWAVP